MSSEAMSRRKKQQYTPSGEAHKQIEEQTEEFLKSGGEITEIPIGKTGRQSISEKNKPKYGSDHLHG